MKHPRRSKAAVSIAAFLFICASQRGFAAPPPAQQVTELTASDGQANQQFGFAVAMSRNVLVTSAPSFDESRPGAVYVFVNSGGDWSQVAKLTASDGGLGDRFGYAVAIAGRTIVVGNDTDAAYVFVEPQRGWADMTETARLAVAGESAAGSVGISPDESTIIAGVPCDHQASAAFYLPPGGWVDTDTPDAMLDGDGAVFVSVSKEVVALGNPGCTNGTVGSVAVFRMPRCHCTLKPASIVQPKDSHAGDGFGIGVSLQGDALLVGGNSAGYIFQSSPQHQPIQVAKLTAPDTSNSCFGCSLKLIQSGAIIGADSYMKQGGVFGFLKPKDGWHDTSIPSLVVTPPNGMDNDFFGTSVASANSLVGVGAPNFTVNGNTNQGAVFVFGTGTGK